MERALMCPQCNAPLAPKRFAQSVVCSYCGTTIQLDEQPSVSAARFREAFRVWNSPESYRISSWLSIGDSHWALNKRIARGNVSDVYTAQRARWLTELAVIKLARDHRNASHLDREWDALQVLQRSDAPGADNFTMLIPQPILHGDVTHGAHAGVRVNIFRWTSGFYYTFEEALQMYPQGIPPRASIWVWRRILEVLFFIHSSGMVHGAVTPPHLLIQENEHGVLLVGYGSAGHAGEKIDDESRLLAESCQLPARLLKTLTPQLDMVMSARCMITMLGGNPRTGSLPAVTPKRLAEIVLQTAFEGNGAPSTISAWDIREELGRIANEVFGAPQFIPIVMPA